MKIQKSAEDYLEAMLILKEKNGYIRSIDIAERLGVTKPSVSYAVKNLRENGYIEVGESSLISLTARGLEIAEKIYSRHKALSEFFESIGVPADIAAKDACLIEHDISEVTFSALCGYADRIKNE